MSNICMGDNIIRPFTYDDAVLILRNVNPEQGDIWDIMKQEIRQWAMDDIQDAMSQLDEHKDEVWAAAFPDDEKPLISHPDFAEAKIDALAHDIQKFLMNWDAWMDVCIYYNGKRMDTGRDGEYRYNGEPFTRESEDPREYFEYVANPHILSMSFEGLTYELLNGYRGGHSEKFCREFINLLSKYGVYFEQGDAWNLTCYPL